MCARQFGLSSNPAAAAQATNLLYQIERDTQLLGLCARRACALGADCLFEAGARARAIKSCATNILHFALRENSGSLSVVASNCSIEQTTYALDANN